MPPWSPHREPDWTQLQSVHGAIAEQAWRTCRPCGGVTAVVLHGSTAHRCDRGHLTITTSKGDQ